MHETRFASNVLEYKFSDHIARISHNVQFICILCFKVVMCLLFFSFVMVSLIIICLLHNFIIIIVIVVIIIIIYIKKFVTVNGCMHNQCVKQFNTCGLLLSSSLYTRVVMFV